MYYKRIIFTYIKGGGCMENSFFKREKVPEILQKRGMSLREFAGHSGLSLSSLSAWLRGTREPKLSNIRKIAHSLNCKVSDIC